jgi:hypothetical protein
VTTVRLHLEACGSVFVVFRRSSSAVDPVAEVTRNGRRDDAVTLTASSGGGLQLLASRPGNYSVQLASGQKIATTIDSAPPAAAIDGKWDVSFPDRSGSLEHISFNKLESWTAQSLPAVKYFSGTATYTKEFSIPADLLNTQRRVCLDLGNVQVIAQLKINDIDYGVLWKPPFETDITKALKPGKNFLHVKVTNLWPNRLIGDEYLPEDCSWKTSVQSDAGYPIAEWPDWLSEDKPSPAARTTFTTWKHWHKDSPLLDSGLLGPVTLRILEQRTLR